MLFNAYSFDTFVTHVTSHDFS